MRRGPLPAGLALAGLLALAACAGAGQNGTPVAAQTTCRLARTPDTLLSLARCCAADLASNPSCRVYDREHGYVIVKDNAADKPKAYLIIPVEQVTGMEDPAILRRPVAEFWHYGWEQSHRFLGAAETRTALAINSLHGRTQNQLHIHIACVRGDVAAALAGLHRSPTWTPVRLGPERHPYQVMRVHGLSAADSPFLRVAAMGGAGQDMGDRSIAVLGTATPGVYELLVTTAGTMNPGSAEELMDQSCSAPDAARPG